MTQKLLRSAGCLLILLLACMLPQRAAADTYVDRSYNYSVMLSGAQSITIKVPCYDQEGADCWVSNGILTAEWESPDPNDSNKKISHKDTCFQWWRDGDTDSDSKDIYIHFRTKVGGTFDVTQGNSGSHFTLVKDNGEVSQLVYRNNDGNTYSVEAVWRVPYDMLGCTVKFTWDVERDGNSRSKEKVSGLNPTTITLPKAQATIYPQVTMATMSYGTVGKIEVPWFMSATTITAMCYEYTDANGNRIKQDMPVNENNGTVLLDATVPHKSFRVVASYKDDKDNAIDNIPSAAQNLQMIHAPLGLTATPLSGAEANRKAKVRLDWTIQHRSTDDIAPSDFFEVQRSLTGREADFVTITSVPLSLDVTSFSYVDSTIVEALTAELLTGGGTLDSLTYRVRRTITQSWGWTGNPCAVSAKTAFDELHLLRLKTWSAEWADKRAFTVRVKWDYADEYHAVWDDRAKLMMLVTMKNNAGETVDTRTYELTSDEQAAREKVIDLSRPCLKYDIEMYVDPGTSPLKNYEDIEHNSIYFPIYSEADWNTFRSKVQEAKGQYDVNARLYADISSTQSCGYSTFPFRGHFDGNGHTLTMNINTTVNNEAPFKFAKDYTIENLTIKGTIKGGRHTAGLVGSSDGSSDKVNVIRNCRVSATVECVERYVGGFIGHGHEGNHHFTNCLFDGKMKCSGGGDTYGGAFIGWGSADAYNGVFNCFEAGSYEGISHLSQNFLGSKAYIYDGNNWSLNGLSTSDKDKKIYVINTVEDWNNFANAVQAADGKYDVDAVLNADLTVSTLIGASSHPYSGTFNGVGHTITVNINSTNEFTAPFFCVNSATIMNLKVKGTVKGGNFSAGLVGCAYKSIRLENIEVYTSVTTTRSHLGGVIGAPHDAKVEIEDCYSAVNLKAEGPDAWGAGIMGWGYDRAYLWHLNRVYDGSTYTNIPHQALVYYLKDGTFHTWGGGGTVCLTSHNYRDIYAGYCNLNPDQAAKFCNRDQPGSWENGRPVMDTSSAGTLTTDQLLLYLGSGWQKVEGTVLPIAHTFDSPVATYPTPTLPDFYHEGNGIISKTLLTETRQSSVVLTWAMEDGVVDYFQVYRRRAGTTEWGSPIATNIDKMGYEDKTVSPLQKYEYKVVAVTDCEGRHTSETEVKPGSCKNTGRVSGYVRMSDGTGAAGIEVEIAAEGNEADKITVATDASGYFMADELSYFGGQSITYVVTPVSRDGIELEVESYPATFNDSINDRQLKDFTITSGYRFSGYVMYEGTSIPVKGANFRVDGRLMHDASNQLVETDYDGSFSFRVLGGNRKIQVTMDGHTFADDGYYKGEAGHYFNDDVAQIYFYDTKKVRLAGRVVGGDDQGRLPLQNNLSRNNLGDNLTMVLTLEGDNTSWLVYDNLNPGLSQRIDTVWHNGGKHRTVVKTQRKRMEVMPDSVTGEFELELPPVRWKVQQVYCDGYATLFQDGQVSEVVDLTNCLSARDTTYEGTYTDVDDQSVYQPRETCKARYSRIYHAPVEITYRQIGYDTFSYFGDKSYVASTVDGTKAEVPLAYESEEIVGYEEVITGYEEVITGYEEGVVGYEFKDHGEVFNVDSIVGYRQVEKYASPFDLYTHKPALTPTDGLQEDWNPYNYMFDNKRDTNWDSGSFSKVEGKVVWVEFNTDHPVSVKQYTMTTYRFASTAPSSNPRTWKLKARAGETDEWTVIANVEDGQMEAISNKDYTYDVSDQGFYQYFRLEVLQHADQSDWTSISIAEFSLTCRGKEDSKPGDPLEPYMSEEPIIEKVTISEKEYLERHVAFTPSLTATNSVNPYAYYKAENLFDGDVQTEWFTDVLPTWVDFKTDRLVSVKQYTMTTQGHQYQAEQNPGAWTLQARASKSDEWKVIATVEDGHMYEGGNTPFTFDVEDKGFYQYFRLHITQCHGTWQSAMTLAELSLTCRGNEDAELQPVYDQVPVYGKTPIYGKKAVINDKGAHYTFGHPVFSVGRAYPIEISVGENYIYNNDARTKKVDRVSVGGGIVNIHNGMKNGTQQDTVRLNANGQGVYYLFAEATTRLLTSEDALHTVTMTLTQDGTTYEATPLRGYTLNMFSTGGAKDVLVAGKPLLIDILRDPPGGGSSATLSKGSTLKYSYTLDMSLSAGLSLDISTGSGVDNYTGSVAVTAGVGTTAGLLNEASSTELVNMSYTFDMEGHKAYTYTMNVSQDISTSSEAGMVGADADLYIGMTQNIVTTTYSTIRAITDDVYKTMLGRIGGGQTAGVKNPYGTLVHIAEGRDANDSIYHLVRDESIGYGPELQSQFIHSQKHIITELIPAKLKELRDLMFTGTASEAQTKANATGEPVYRSLRDVNDGRFAMMNMKDGKIFYYTSTMAEDTTMNYVIHLPAGTTNKPTDEVAAISQIVYDWVQMLAQNEHEKLAATEHLANYDVDGGTTVSYSESFESEFDTSNYYHLPGIVGADYFDDAGSDAGTAFASLLVTNGLTYIMKNIWHNYVNTSATGTHQGGGKGHETETSVKFAGSTFTFKLLPILNYTTKDVSGESHTFSRKESFNISMDKLSHLNFDVYRVLTDTTTMDDNGLADVFTNRNFAELTQKVENNLRRGVDIRPDNIRYARSFVYRTRGGATANPWEGERKTKFWQPGTVLDERTKKIENPKITVDRQSVSGVPYGETARFTLYLTNDSEDPEAASKTISTFNLYSSDANNPYGASVKVDGQVLNASGRSIILTPGEVVTKVVEVSGGNSFDLEGLTIGICSDNDWRQIYDEVSLDVHYLHQAGPVNIATPGDKWVMNTYAEKDDRGWFLPVTIDGFDKHQHNFDHIEFQYKESLRGDDSWTNLCSYYASDSLMALASGVRELIPENGNIEAHFYGEGTVMEKAYDLRAVLYCRNGNSFLTTASPIISGVKDTRLPRLFGTPEPKNGILRVGDDIVFNFSEDIEYNYLNSVTNFEVKGEVNNQSVSDAVCVQFAGEASVESEAQRNFSDKDLTIDLMIRPDKTGKDMPLFSHGTNGKRMQLWLTGDYKLKAVIDEHSYTSSDTIIKSGFTQVAMSINMTDSVLTFYNGGKEIGAYKLEEGYNGTGKLIFGRTNETDRTKSQYYAGRMMEARVWYRAMTGGLIGTTYGSRRLTGYETGLVDYYPMNEGTGDYVLDKTQGANAQLIGASWAMPRGMSLHVDWEDRGIGLTQNALNRTAEQDYTLMFWFRTDAEGHGVLLSNGAGTKDEIGAGNIFNIAFEAEKLMYRSNGMAVEVPGDWSNGQWHHYAMTVNRAHSLANIYVDNTLCATFDTDSLGGISGGHPLIGAARYSELREDGTVATIDTRNWLRGNIDELCMFAQALPLTLIRTYSTKSPGGDEAGLLTYLSFDRQERQKDNDIETVAYAYSRKIYKDDKGEVRYEKDPVTMKDTDTPVRDYLFESPIDDILGRISGETAAPVVPYEELHNLKFSFAGKDNQIYVGLEEQAQRLNHRNIYVTMRDVEDKNGNALASPQTACYYVVTSSLQWQNNRTEWLASYGMEEYIYLDIINNSATMHTFTIENCPKWLKPDSYTGVIGPLGSMTIKAQVNKGLNVGTYDEIIYLTDEDGVSEPLYLNLTVTTSEPEWAWSVDGDLLKYSMNIAGQVYLNDEIDIDTRDIVGAFGDDGRCHGIAHVNYSALTGEAGLYLTVYDSETSGRELYFKLWQYSTGRELMLIVDGSTTLTFRDKAVLGTDTPVRFEGGSLYVQTFNLKEGWNWVSFNVASEKLFNLNTLLDGLPWKEGDVLTDMNSDLTLVYKEGHWLSSEKLNSVRLSPRKAYAIKVQEDIQFPVAGSVIRQLDTRTIELKQGWNGIGYTPMLNLSVETALSDYYDKAEAGDVIKSHDEFAYFTVTGGVGRWRGSLEYMKPGEGYMLLRKAASETTFTYPFYEPGSTFLDEWAYSSAREYVTPTSLSTMSVSAVVEGFEPEEGDRLVAYANGEMVGSSLTPSPSPNGEVNIYYLSIEGDAQAPIRFAIERDGDIIASTPEQMTFSANAVVGSPDEPTVIRFTNADEESVEESAVWYDLSGRRIGIGKAADLKLPAGIYIRNGKKVIIK